MAGIFQSELNKLTGTQTKFLCDHFDVTEAELLSASEEWLDDVYDELCDLESELTPVDDSELSDEGKIVSDIVTLLGNAIAEAEGYFDEDDFNFDGGPGSGNWGHAGRPGKKGGSAGGGGKHNRMTAPDGSFTSFAKQKKAMATPHKTNIQELSKCPDGTKILVDGKSWTKWTLHQPGDDDLEIAIEDVTGEAQYTNFFMEKYQGYDVSYALPDSANPNYQKVKESKGKDVGDDPDLDRFSEERRNNAFKPMSKVDADEVYRENTGKVWQNLDDDTKYALNRYTGSAYHDINSNLRAGYDGDPDVNRKVNLMTDAIDQVAMPRDAWLSRGVSTEGFVELFGLDPDVLYSSDLPDLTGRIGKDNGFMSCGSAVGTGMSTKSVQIEIYCPAGTKGIYAEPFSQFGNGHGVNWDEAHADGVSGQTSFSGEFETILQRGTSLQLLDFGYGGNGYTAKAMVVSQDPEPFGPQ